MDIVRLHKRAQLTLFIIFGVVIVGAILFILISYKPELNIFKQKTSSPVEYLTDCIEDSIQSSEKEFFSPGGFMKDSTLNYRYNKQTMPFLCYSTEFYSPCVPQNPLLIESLRKNMENKVSRDFSQCILTLKEDYEKRGYNVGYSSFDLSLIFNELDISYEVNLDISLSKNEETILISTRQGSISSILPKFLRTAETIVNYESVFCEFNYIGWQATNRDLKITRFRGGDQTKVYTLTDRNSDKEIKFAIRTCVLPAGL